MEAYYDLEDRNSLEESENPIAKLPLGVTGVGMQLLIEVITTEDENRSGNNIQRGKSGMHDKQVSLLTSQVVHLGQSIANIEHELEHCDIYYNTLLCQINCNLSPLVVTPGDFIIGD